MSKVNLNHFLSWNLFKLAARLGDAIVSGGVSAEYELAVRPPANGIHGFATPFLPPTAALATSYVLSLQPIYSTLFSSSAAARKTKKTLTFHLPSKFLLFSSHFFYLHLADWSRFMARSPPFPRKFFKPLTPGFQNGMAIPIAFTTSLGEKKLDKALIKSCQGSWDVKVHRTCDGVFCFKQGWKEVVKNHSLEVGEFLVFEHKGNMVFNVKVYEPLGCEKKFPPPSFRLIMAKTHWNVKCPGATIPLDFARSTGILDKSCMRVKDPFGKSWPMDIGIVKDKEKIEVARSCRMYLKSKGWIEFYKANKLKDADVCIFELIRVPRSRSKPVIMNVKIFRFGS